MIEQSRASCAAAFVPLAEWNDGGDHPPGSFTIEEMVDGTKEMLFKCPSGDGAECAIKLRPCAETPSWEFSGDLTSPTLHPSVHRQFKRRGTGALGTIWHGWLRNGEWVSC
ncbi:DUF6527 family protein [Maricaulis maris]|uniref:Uncharacterized protein n=1 Tax=Maricaulis maris TaxID=74318 RepID=A0A495DL95_9PROT|nr:DUF6527 family protein [Maricaulis maris]RKR02688.1 hypothetical protein C7435_0627 [Maricaulis maris]